MSEEIDKVIIADEDVSTEEIVEPVDGEERDWKAEATKFQGLAKRRGTQLAKAREKLSKTETVVSALAEKPAQQDKTTSKTGELDETQLDYLDLKGISEQEDIDVIQKVMVRTGQTVRQVLKDEYVSSKLDANKKGRIAQNAMPSSTNRGSQGQANNLEAAIAKYEQTRELPSDFELRSAVVNALEARSTGNAPAWRK